MAGGAQAKMSTWFSKPNQSLISKVTKNSVFGRVSYYLLFEFVWEGVGWGLALINFSAFRMGANSRLGAYSNKYGIQLERRALLALYWTAGTDLVVLTFQLLLDCNFFFFLVFFLLFFLCHFLLYFLDLFFDSLPSLTHLPPPPPRPLCSRQEGTTILFCSRSFIRLFRVLGLRKKYGLLCGLKDFALINVLVSWKL